MPVKTSLTHPIEVDWLPTPWPGKVGLTLGPGKKVGDWNRDLDVDMLRLREAYDIARLVTLLEDDEMKRLRVRELVNVAAVHGIAVERLAIRDVDVPTSIDDVRRLVGGIIEWAQAGDNVAIHCRGGLGRSGTIGGCVLIAAGASYEEALAALEAARGPNCPETAKQRLFIKQFAESRRAVT